MIENVSRRDFFKASGALILAVSFKANAQFGRLGFAPNAFVQIDSDSTVTVIVKHLEMGQGTYTGLPTLVAEELDADWAQIRVEGAPADAKRYNNLFWGPAQGTGGILGGYSTAAFARKLDPRYVRVFVIVVGWAMTIYFFARK